MKQEQIILNAYKAMLQGALDGLIDYIDSLYEINRNPHWKKPECIKEILLESKRPMSTKEVHTKLKNRYGKDFSTINSIRVILGTMSRRKKGEVIRIEQGVYGIRKKPSR